MIVAHEVISVNGLHRVTLCCREDGTYGYTEFRNAGTVDDANWQVCSLGHSRFDSLDTAIQEAKKRIPWLKLEINWPAKDFAPLIARQYIVGWVECPYCHIKFSLTDPNRCGSGRHLTCGQRFLITAPNQDRNPLS